jgi:hypothetical protein
MLTATIHPTLPVYVSKKGNDTFVYVVTGDPTSLKAFKKAKGTFYREEDGKPLFFTIDFFGNSGDLIITSKGNVIADKSQFKKAQSLSSQFSGSLGDAIATQFAQQLLGGKSPSNIAQNVPEQNVSDEPEKL